jgi:hypothetical protein
MCKGFGQQISDFRWQISDGRIQTAEFRLQNSDCRIQTADFRFKVAEFRFQNFRIHSFLGFSTFFILKSNYERFLNCNLKSAI